MSKTIRKPKAPKKPATASPSGTAPIRHFEDILAAEVELARKYFEAGDQLVALAMVLRLGGGSSIPFPAWLERYARDYGARLLAADEDERLSAGFMLKRGTVREDAIMAAAADPKWKDGRGRGQLTRFHRTRAEEKQFRRLIEERAKAAANGVKAPADAAAEALNIDPRTARLLLRKRGKRVRTL